MYYEIDTHCHTVSSGHAYSTVTEIANEARNKGLKLVGITDHGPKMPGGPHVFHILNQKVYPDTINGVEILKGVEANIIDYNGKLDIEDKYLSELDLVIASLHTVCINPGNEKENTFALIKAMENKYVDIIAHPGNPEFPINKKELVLKAKETNTLIEINNSSLGKSRVGSLNHCIEIAKLCKEHNVNIVVGSDSHICYDVGEFSSVTKLLNEIEMPKELIINLSVESFKEYLKMKGKRRFLNL